MPESYHDVISYLQSKQIVYTLHEHPAVYTCEEAEVHCADIPGLACKNLFLRNRKGDKYFLIILPAHKRADLKKIGKIIGDDKIRFASAEKLNEILGLTAGSVSPFGLINDTDHHAIVYVDRDVYDADVVGFHPNKNTATLELTGIMFRKFLTEIGHDVHILE